MDLNQPLSSYIEHTLLKPDATRIDVLRLCEEAIAHQFVGVCVSPWLLPVAVSSLQGTLIIPVTVVGFSSGAMTTNNKVAETKEAIAMGAKEIDMVINLGALRAQENDYVREDIRAVVRAAANHPVKVIIETALLSTEEKIRAARLCVEAGAQYVKTSTGFAGGGAVLEDIILLRKTVGPNFLIKASGGIKTKEEAIQLIQGGANRIGTSKGLSMV